MSRLEHKAKNQSLRRARARRQIAGANQRPRLSVKISNKHVSAQIIDDNKKHTLAVASTVGSKNSTGTMTEKAALLGAEIAKKAKSAKVKRVVFDRGDKKYHGRVKALADSARKSGLEF